MESAKTVSINVVVFLLKLFNMNFSTGNYQTHEEYRLVNMTTDLSSSFKVNKNRITKSRGDNLTERV
jgi:hypothetical protein